MHAKRSFTRFIGTILVRDKIDRSSCLIVEINPMSHALKYV